MPKRYHLNRPDLAQAVAVELRICQDVKSQQRLLAARLAASGQFTAAQIAEQVGISRRHFFNWLKRSRRRGGGPVGTPAWRRAAPQVQGDARQEVLAGLQSGRWKRAKEIQHWLREHQAMGLKWGCITGWENWAGS